MKEVFLVAGKAQNGKGTFASLLKEQIEINTREKVLIISFGDLVKFVCANYLGWDGKKDAVGRTTLQYVGTDLVRKKEPNFWRDWVVKLVGLFEDEFQYCIIPDVRFKNEIEFSDKWKVTTIRVNRLNFESPLTEEQQNHRSETELDDFDFDYNVYASSLQELKASAVKFAERIYYESNN